MNRRWMFGGLLVLVMGAIAAFSFWGPDRDWGPRDHGVELVQIVDDEGNPVEGASTIVVERDRHGFPFALFLIPLLLLVFGLSGAHSGDHPVANPGDQVATGRNGSTTGTRGNIGMRRTRRLRHPPSRPDSRLIGF